MEAETVPSASSERETTAIQRSYFRIRNKNFLIAAAVMTAAVFISLFSILCSVHEGLTIQVSFEVLIKHLQGSSYGDYYKDLIVWDYYVPRAIACVFVGAGLAVGGCVMQTIMRNPLADPYTTGVASGASFGVSLFIMMGFALLPDAGYSLSLTVNAIAFSIIPTVAIIAISKRKTITPTTMILAGIAIMYVFRAATTLMTLYSDSDAVELVYRWNVGSVKGIEFNQMWVVVGVTVVCSAILMYLAHDITMLTAGDKNARSMGVRTKLIRVLALATIAIMTATIVGFTGTIGFMGLVAPHAARMFVGSNLKYLIPCSAAFGAIILVVCDLVAKIAFADALPVGVLTAILGGPIFIILLIKGARKVWY